MSRLERLAYYAFCTVICAIPVAFVAFIVAAVVNSYRLEQECVARGGVPTRYVCLKPEALLPRGQR